MGLKKTTHFGGQQVLVALGIIGWRGGFTRRDKLILHLLPGLKVVNYFGCAIVIASNIGSRGRTTHSKSGFGSIIYKLKVFLKQRQQLSRLCMYVGTVPCESTTTTV